MRDKHYQRKERDTDYKDRGRLREANSATRQHGLHRGVLKDYSLKHQVSIEYDMNDDSFHDQMFILKIDDYEVLLDYEELTRIGRFI